MPDRSEGEVKAAFGKELGRKVIHTFALFYLVIYFACDHLAGPQLGLLVLVGLLVAVIIIEYLRLERQADIPLLSWLWANFRREKEQAAVGAEIFFLLGVIVALGSFEQRVATTAVLMTVFGDLTAALVGMRLGRIRPRMFHGKSIEGSLAAAVVNLCVGWVVMRDCGGGTAWWQVLLDGNGYPGLGEPLWTVIVSMAAVATVTELIISEIDDNLTIPVLSGFAGQVVWFLLRWL
ncbi:SEC59/DGK1/VTE5 family protein [bacterium]|nr:SEC59/DGK1/VTE5 family protein [bacterium]